MDPEWRNVWQRCRRPLFAAALASHWVRLAGGRLLARGLGHTRRYPPQVRAAFEQAASDSAFRRREPAPVSAGKAAAALGSYELGLAVGSLACQGSPDWNRRFDDAEQLVSLHRWNWLLTKRTDGRFPGLRDWGLALMLDWCGTMQGPKRGLPWEPYTTGERICNAVLFLASAEGDVPILPALPVELKAHLLDMAGHLSANLEYAPSGFAWNHVLNNARALYFAGQTLEAPSCSRLALAIMRHDLPAIVNSEGFLREGSVHYHFLVVRWLLEMVWLARATGDRACLDLLEPVAAAMVRRCWTFLIFDRDLDDWTIPLIGDVSPDFSWAWLVGLPWSEPACRLYAPPRLPQAPRQRGWGRLFAAEPSSGANRDEGGPGGAEPRLEHFPMSGWYRFDLGRLTLFWHVEPAGAPSFVSHGHCDTGAFALYWDGMAVLTDPGRLNYQEDDALGTYGRSARAHNNVTIDGLEPFVYKNPNRLPRFYRGGEAQVQWKSEEAGLTLTIEHGGFHRLHGDPVSFRRQFTVRRDALAIEDRLEGWSQHRVETFFQWAPGITATRAGQAGRFAIRHRTGGFDGVFWSGPDEGPLDDGACWTELRGRPGPSPGGWYFPGYGEKMEAQTLVHGGLAALPCIQRFVLKWTAPSP